MVGLAELGPGDYFGEMGLLDGTPRSASAVAETRVEVDEYDRDGLARRISADPEFAMGMMRAMSGRLREVDDRLADLVAQGRLESQDAISIAALGPC